MSPGPLPLARHPTRRALLAALGAAGLAGAAADEAPDRALQAAIDGPHRSADHRARDAARHPYETLRFFGLQRTHTVIEAAPGGGWYTEILAPWLRGHGRLIAAHFARDDASQARRRARAAFEAWLAAHPELYDEVRVGTLPRGPAFTDISVAGGADAVLTFRNVHNWLAEGHLDATLGAFHRALKPGGVLGVVEHRAQAGTPPERTRVSGYVDEEWMVERARAAGFVLQARSEVNANPRDTKDHAHGVWSLPPTLRGGTVDEARLRAIGESDRFTHRYVKPLRQAARPTRGTRTG